jgi:hypothetical protein
MAFQGSLAELHLPDIIQLISVSGKSGVFQLVDGPHRGQIYLHEGKIVHAELEDVSGEEAVYALAIWSQGDFRFDPGVATQLRTISKSNTNLLMEAARRLDEWRVLSKKIPSTDLVPEFVVQEHREGQINLNTSEWLILSKIDGRRSIKAIAAACGLSVFDASKILYGLIATGLIRLRDAGTATGNSASRPAARPAAAAAAAPASGEPITTLGAAVSAELLTRLGRVREVCIAQLGAVGESVVNKHYQKARAELERGAGSEAIEEAVAQIARAASILKGPAITEVLLEQLKSVR